MLPCMPASMPRIRISDTLSHIWKENSFELFYDQQLWNSLIWPSKLQFPNKPHLYSQHHLYNFYTNCSSWHLGDFIINCFCMKLLKWKWKLEQQWRLPAIQITNKRHTWVSDRGTSPIENNFQNNTHFQIHSSECTILQAKFLNCDTHLLHCALEPDNVWLCVCCLSSADPRVSEPVSGKYLSRCEHNHMPF